MQKGAYKSGSQLSNFDAACEMVEKIFQQVGEKNDIWQDLSLKQNVDIPSNSMTSLILLTFFVLLG